MSPTNKDNNNKDSLTLYTYWRSSCSYRVRIYLSHLSIPYTSVPIHLVKGQQKEDTYSKNVNYGMSQVPTLAISHPDGTVSTLTQSLAIIKYLDLTYSTPTTTLTPSSVPPLVLAKSAAIAEIINSGIQPLQNFTTMKTITTQSGGAMNGRDFGKDAILKGLSSVESIIKSLHGDVPHCDYTGAVRHCTGPSYPHLTIGDICIVPQVYNAKRFDVDVGDLYPYLNGVYEYMVGLRIVKEAKPESQGDAQVVDAQVQPPPEKKQKT
mmetsp:Transcript_21846/g.45512  ORF Transcript_21846/g.45512 Transcript_21846/m.45512 type:complete len:265 (+) Transcript_21846:333-1127(+)